MTDEAQQLFLDALEVDEIDRAQWLAQRCADRPTLAGEVARLLAADRVAEGFLDPPVPEQAGDGGGGWLEGRVVGSYTILRRIGVGGMGTVYEAMQQRPRRRVALKLLRTGLSSPELRGRFEQEAEILGRLRHRGIAEIYEAGTYDSELGPIPYFALEFVEDARTLSAWVDESRPDPAVVVATLIEICDAVAHAHASHVIHRDIKPSNVLVGRDGRLRLIDFGVARATDDAARVTLATAVGDLVGTLHYMSPEQCSFDGAEIDIRTDVYALGVVLYELLAGRLPYPLAGVAPAMIPELVRSHRPSPPLHGRGLARRWTQLDDVVLTALEKSPRDRYASAEAFADDLRRVLRGEPVHATRSRRRVALRRLGWRSRRALPLVALAASLGVGGWSLWRAGATTAATPTNADEAARERHRHRIATAERARDSGEFAVAKRALQESPPDQRGWEWWRLAAQLDSSTAHADLGSPVDALALDPASRRLAAVTEGGALVVLDVDDAELSERWRVDVGEPYLTAAVDLDTVYVAGDGGRIHRFSLDDGARLATLGSAGSSIWGLAVVDSPHGVLATHTDGTLARWDLPQASLRYAQDLGGRPGHLTVRDGRWLTALDDDTALIGDLATGEVTRRAPLPSRAEALELDASDVFTGGWGRVLSRFDRDDPGARRIDVDLPAPILALARVDQETMAVAGADGLVRLCDRSGRVLDELRGHDFEVRTLLAAHAGDSLYSGSTDGTVRRWALRRPSLDTVLAGAREKIHALAWSSDGAAIVTGGGVEWDRSADNELIAWHATRGGIVERRRDHAATIEAVVATAAWVASADRDGVIVVRDPLELTPRTRLRGHEGGVLALAVANDGASLLSGGADGSVASWDPEGRLLTRTAAEVGAVRALGWRDGLLVVAGERGVAWWRDGDPAIERVAIDDATAVTIDARARIFVADGRGELRRLGDDGWRVDVLGRRIHALSLSPDDSRLAVASEDGRVRLVDPHDGVVIAVVGSHALPVRAVEFSPDGRSLASGGFDLQARIWRSRFD